MSDEPGDRDYQAIEPKDRTRRRSIELRLRDGRRYWLKYADRHLMALSPDQSALTLFFYSLSVVILGRGLLEAASAIDGENLAWLQEFDSRQWDRPIDPQAMVIDSVEIYQPKQDDGEGGDGPSMESAGKKVGAATH